MLPIPILGYLLEGGFWFTLTRAAIGTSTWRWRISNIPPLEKLKCYNRRAVYGLLWPRGLYVACQPSPGKDTEWVAIPFSRVVLTQESNPGSPALQADSLPTELPGKPHFQTITEMCEALWGWVQGGYWWPQLLGGVCCANTSRS